MGEAYRIGIEFVGKDDATDEITSVSEGLRRLGEANEEVVSRAKEVVRQSREQRTVLRAVQEESQVFGERAQFVARQLNEVAGLGASVSKIITSLDTSMTRLHTAQLVLASAQERQATLLKELNAQFGIQASSVEEAGQALRRMLETGEASGPVAERIKSALKGVEEVQKQLQKASGEVEASMRNLQAQMVAAGLSSIELVPKFMSVVNGFSAVVSLSPTLGSALGAVKGAFAALYASMGPVGLILVGIGTAAAVLVANWEKVAPVFEGVASAVSSALGPALEWLLNNVLSPIASFLQSVLAEALDWVTAQVRTLSLIAEALSSGLTWLWKSVLEPLAAFLIGQLVSSFLMTSSFVDAATKTFSEFGEAAQWVWNNSLVPLVRFIADQAVATVRTFGQALSWLSDVARNTFSAIHGTAESLLRPVLDLINSVVSGIQSAFAWLHDQLVGHSIVPELWKEIVRWTEWGYGETSEKMERLLSSLNVEGTGTSRSITLNVTLNVNAPLMGEMNWVNVAETVSRTMLNRIRMAGPL
ncbi:MAG: hypothetical protein NZ988_06245 [Thaumarchaeota archaeon]|nr:hypothetical protein [Candidatus Calditenuaceae archaeon]MDW8187623.1 hypothetical protein [Nitrososphaerota archaeon]